jgi:hypothetical protein
VDARHFNAAERASKSLGYKNAGPWRIIRVIDGKAYELELSYRIIWLRPCLPDRDLSPVEASRHP